MPCPTCDVYASMVPFLQEQVKTLTEMVQALQRPYIGTVVGQPSPAVEHAVDEHGKTTVYVDGNEVPLGEWGHHMKQLDRYEAGLAALPVPAEG